MMCREGKKIENLEDPWVRGSRRGSSITGTACTGEEERKASRAIQGRKGKIFGRTQIKFIMFI